MIRKLSYQGPKLADALMWLLSRLLCRSYAILVNGSVNTNEIDFGKRKAKGRANIGERNFSIETFQNGNFSFFFDFLTRGKSIRLTCILDFPLELPHTNPGSEKNGTRAQTYRQNSQKRHQRPPPPFFHSGVSKVFFDDVAQQFWPES